MPFTPFHLGPGLLLGLLFFSVLHLPTFLLASVIVDAEPLYAIIACPSCAHHGFWHSFLGGTIAAVFLGTAMVLLDRRVRRIMALFRLGQKATKKTVFLAAFSGVYLHLLLDSLLYPDMKPFYPLGANPFYIGNPAFVPVYALCALLFIAGLGLWAAKRNHY